MLDDKKIHTLATTLYADVFATLDALPDLDGHEAGAVAAEVERAFRAALVRAGLVEETK